MSITQRSVLDLESLTDRITPTTAVFSNGVLTIQGDNHGNAINVSAATDGTIQVTERGQAVTVTGATTATTTTVKFVVEEAGTGANNTLSTSASLGAIPDTLLGNGTGTMTFTPGNNAPSTAIGSPNAHSVNFFVSNPGGKDVFLGGKGYNLFDWQPGTGTDTYMGAGKGNTVLVVGNANGTAESDTLTGDGTGGVIYTRNSPVPFSLYTRDIQNWDLQPSTGAGNTVTIGYLSGTATKQVQVDLTSGTVDASGQNSSDVKLVVNGSRNTVSEGAGATRLTNTTPPTTTDLLNGYLARL
jgi:hypothetical protein